MVSKNKNRSLPAAKVSKAATVKRKRPRVRHVQKVSVSRSETRYLEDMLDMDSMRIISMLTKGEMTDCLMAEKLKIRANTVRRACNELHVRGMLTYRKEKQKNGWYDYIWWIKDTRLPEIIKNHQAEYLGLLQKRVDQEKDASYFICKNNCQQSMRMDHEEMLKSGAICPDCGGMLTAYDNSKEIGTLNEEIDRFREIGK